MDYRQLGNTGLLVSRLCFGSLTISPIQANLPIKKGAEIIKYAYSKGINFIDTAELYDNYEYIEEVLKYVNRKEFVIATKSYSHSRKTAKESLNKALKGLNTDYIDLFLLHEQEGENTIRGHYEAVSFFMEAKKKGIIRAFGISTHKIQAVKDSMKFDEIEVIHPIVNKTGLGIQDGSIDEMIDALKSAYNTGKGIYSMKPLGGGHLIKNVEEAFNFVRNLSFLHSIAVGIQSKEEVDADISLISTGSIPSDIKSKIDKKERILHIADWCVGCSKCVEKCNHGGIIVINGKADAVKDKCIFCGYCAKVCPEFCIKVI